MLHRALRLRSRQAFSRDYIRLAKRVSTALNRTKNHKLIIVYSKVKWYYNYITCNFKTPNNSKGEIIFGFFVEINGTLNDFEIIKSINKEIDLAVIRLLVKSPKWTPGKIDGKNYTCPI